MPTILIKNGYRFYFYSQDCAEPPHVHVDKGDKKAKVWLQPLEVAWNRGYNARELNEILDIIREYRAMMLERWNEHCENF
jgi:hypothetical protein